MHHNMQELSMKWMRRFTTPSAAAAVITLGALGMTCRAAAASENYAAPGPQWEQAPPPAPGAPPPPENDSAAAEKPREGTRRIDHLSFGVLGGVAFPRPIAVEGLVKIERIVGLGFEYSMLPGITVEGVNTHFWALAADARAFPFKNAFFVGLRAGRQHLGGDANIAMPGVGTVNETMSVDTTFINPRIGFLWTWGPGISLGVNAGVQIPVSTSESSSLPPGTAVDPRITRVANTLGRNVLPTVDLLQIGVML
jgi:hypothetical protein